MDFVGSVVISSKLTLSELAADVGEVLKLRFQHDESGRYEELPAYVATVLGFEVALLLIPAADSVQLADTEHEYQLIVQTFDDAAEYGPEVDLSPHLQLLLSAAGIQSRPDG